MTQPTPVYCVLGSTGGIGQALCRELHNQGARLLLASRNGEKIQQQQQELNAYAATLDCTEVDAVEQFVQGGVNEFGRLDGMVNLVGSLLLKPLHLTSIDEWHHALRQNLDSAFAAVRAGTKSMLKSGGSIVLMTSAAAQIGLNNHEAIAAAKAGIIGLVQSAAATYANRGIRVNAVAPGLTCTPLTERVRASDVAVKASEALHPLGRLGQPEDVASAISWFLNPRQSWVTGQILGVDGGLAHIKSPK